MFQVILETLFHTTATKNVWCLVGIIQNGASGINVCFSMCRNGAYSHYLINQNVSVKHELMLRMCFIAFGCSYASAKN